MAIVPPVPAGLGELYEFLPVAEFDADESICYGRICAKASVRAVISPDFRNA
jgi:hypothetical protein